MQMCDAIYVQNIQKLKTKITAILKLSQEQIYVLDCDNLQICLKQNISQLF